MDNSKEKDAGRISRRLFADIAEWVEPGSPEHLSMVHGYLRGRTKQKSIQKSTEAALEQNRETQIDCTDNSSLEPPETD